MGADKKILYKFVVNDNWVIDPEAPQEDDGHGNLNNVLYPDQIKTKSTDVTTSSAAPQSTTAAMAGQVPLEPRREATEVTPASDSSLNKETTKSSPPGAFPETPQQQLHLVPLALLRKQLPPHPLAVLHQPQRRRRRRTESVRCSRRFSTSGPDQSVSGSASNRWAAGEWLVCNCADRRIRGRGWSALRGTAHCWVWTADPLIWVCLSCRYPLQLCSYWER